MLHLANRTQKAVGTVFRASSKRGTSSTRAGRDSISRHFSSHAAVSGTSNVSSLKLLAIGGLALGASAVVYGVTSQETRSKAETDEPLPALEPRDVLTRLVKGVTYIVGDCVLPGQLEKEPLLVPRAVRSIFRNFFCH